MYDERKNEILKLLSTKGYMTVEELAQHLYIIEPTVRQDLHNLAKEGEIKRIHGGASYVGSTCSFLAEVCDKNDVEVILV